MNNIVRFINELAKPDDALSLSDLVNLIYQGRRNAHARRFWLSVLVSKVLFALGLRVCDDTINFNGHHKCCLPYGHTGPHRERARLNSATWDVGNEWGEE